MLDQLEDNIRRVIADIRPQMLEKSSKIGRPDWTISEPAVAVLCQKSYLKYDTSLKDKPETGRPSDFDDHTLLEAVEEDKNLTTRILAEDFHANQSTVIRHLKKFVKVWETTG
ncbi:hypothetical protein TNCV_3168551 [Trichonephila clavipes]|nr:hypothetical protein TNCV_3168551 [Trichonephila clavipes]